MEKTFKTQMKIRFADCDVAGIVFYPRYFEMVNGVVEDWLADELEWSFSYMHHDRNEGLPTVHVDCQFISPSRIGDVLDFELKVIKLGTSSITLSVTATNKGVPVFKTQNVLVCISLGNIDRQERSVKIPDAMRERILPYVAP